MTAELATSLDVPWNGLTGVTITGSSLLSEANQKARVEGESTQQYSDRLDALKPAVKKKPFVPPEHLTQNPFRENDALKKLQYDLKKETDPKKPVKRTPRRKPATKTTGEK